MSANYLDILVPLTPAVISAFSVTVTCTCSLTRNSMKRLEVCGLIQVNIKITLVCWPVKVFGAMILLKMVDCDCQILHILPKSVILNHLIAA